MAEAMMDDCDEYCEAVEENAWVGSKKKYDSDCSDEEEEEKACKE